MQNYCVSLKLARKLKEVWKPIKGYEGRYSISKSGQVLSHEKIRSDGRVYPEIFLKPALSDSGYYSVSLYREGKVKRLTIHRLIALAYIENPNKFKCINHINGDRTDNRLENLEWCDHSYNSKDGYNRGRVVWNKGLHIKTNNALQEHVQRNGAWNKGLKTGIVPRSAFKRGHTPWNKNLIEQGHLKVEDIK